jgi:ubiquinone/menaquinone biosynthesis C-methylase UbiE
MNTEWDYTNLADAYLLRPDYSDAAIDAMLAVAGVTAGAACDVGAGVAHLTLMLAKRGFEIAAVEPNDAMRSNGQKRTASLFPDVRWYEGTGEQTGQVSASFDIVTFGSSFNVCDRVAALQETARILKPHAAFACMWNHRNLEDPLQQAIETTIQRHIPSYAYGTRREDQTRVIAESGLFGPAVRVSAGVIHRVRADDIVEAWRSHATLARQAGDRFPAVVDAIADVVAKFGRSEVEVPYTTNIWVARKLS